jgi:hypothetical protein
MPVVGASFHYQPIGVVVEVVGGIRSKRGELIPSDTQI